jgi:hypothetical protein
MSCCEFNFPEFKRINLRLSAFSLGYNYNEIRFGFGGAKWRDNTNKEASRTNFGACSVSSYEWRGHTSLYFGFWEIRFTIGKRQPYWSEIE